MKQPNKSLRSMMFLSAALLLSGCQHVDEFFTETHSTTYEMPSRDLPRKHSPASQQHGQQSSNRSYQRSYQRQDSRSTSSPQSEPAQATPTKAPSSSPEKNLQSRGNELQPKPDMAPKIDPTPVQVQKIKPTEAPMVPGTAPTVAP